MTTVPVTPKKRKLRPYVLGAFLSYVFCLVTGGRLFAAGASWSFGLATVGAFFLWPFLAPLHAALQFLLGLVVRRLWNGARHKILVLNAPIVLLIVLAGVAARREPQNAFRSLIADPIPKSVRITQFARSHTIGESLKLGLAFQIQEVDLQTILRAGSYVSAHDSTNTDALEDDRWWVSAVSGIKFDPTVPRQHYLSTSDERSHLLFRTNDSEVFFFYGRRLP